MTESRAAHAGTGPHTKTSNGTRDQTRTNSTDEDSAVMESGAKHNPSKAEHGAGAGAVAGIHSSPKKRRKVNHGKRLLLQG